MAMPFLICEICVICGLIGILMRLPPEEGQPDNLHIQPKAPARSELVVFH